MGKRKLPHLSLLEDDEGARFAGGALGFRARGFGAGFSVEPFFRACGPFRGGGSESDSDFEPDRDSEPDRAGRGFSSSESLSTTFFSEPDPESESESEEPFCNITKETVESEGERASRTSITRDDR